jgi:hypothetical protein
VSLRKTWQKSRPIQDRIWEIGTHGDKGNNAENGTAKRIHTSDGNLFGFGDAIARQLIRDRGTRQENGVDSQPTGAIVFSRGKSTNFHTKKTITE